MGFRTMAQLRAGPSATQTRTILMCHQGCSMVFFRAFRGERREPSAGIFFCISAPTHAERPNKSQSQTDFGKGSRKREAA